MFVHTRLDYSVYSDLKLFVCHTNESPRIGVSWYPHILLYVLPLYHVVWNTFRYLRHTGVWATETYLRRNEFYWYWLTDIYIFIWYSLPLWLYYDRPVTSTIVLAPPLLCRMGVKTVVLVLLTTSCTVHNTHMYIYMCTNNSYVHVVNHQQYITASCVPVSKSIILTIYPVIVRVLFTWSLIINDHVNSTRPNYIYICICRHCIFTVRIRCNSLM